MNSLFSVVLLLASLHLYSFSTQDARTIRVNSGQLNSSIWVGEPPREIILDRYYKGQDLERLLRTIETDFKHIVKLYELGTTAVDNQTIWAVRITTNIVWEFGHHALKPSFKFVANIHGDEAVGNALMVNEPL